MKVTIDIPDKMVPEFQILMDEASVKNMSELFTRAVGFYLWVFRLVHGGLKLAILNGSGDIDGNLIDRKLFCNLFREQKNDGSAPPQN
ncbi:MAG: hypothetical protein WC551_05110 [Patescibacteria group bacterium]